MPRPVSSPATIAASTASVLFCASSVSAALIFWTGGATGGFNNAGNWDLAVPGASDTAIFTEAFAGADDITVSFVSDVTNQGLAVGNLALTLELNGNTYTLSDAVTLLDAELTITGGTLSANVATINSGLLTVADDAIFNTSTAAFGIGAGNDAQIDIAGVWNNTGSLVLGNTGNGEMNIGHDGNASTGTGGAVTTGTLLLGAGNGSQGTINIGEDATLTSASTMIGVGNNATGTVNIGDGGAWTNTGALTVGSLAGTAGTGSITVDDGGLMRTQNMNVGSNGTITQIGAGAIIVGDATTNLAGLSQAMRNRIDSGGLFVAGNGLTLLNGGTVNASAGYIDSFTSDSSGTATVTGLGTLMDFGDGDLIVGGFRNGNLTISTGGRVESGDGIIGERSSSNGTVTVSGHRDNIASQWNINGTLEVGRLGTGQLNILGGGLVTTTGDGMIGDGQNSTGSVLVTGRMDPLDSNSPASTLNIGGNLSLGHGMTGGATSQQNVNATLTVSDGGIVILNNGAGSLTVNNSGLLTGNGTIDGSVQLFGRLSPGGAGQRTNITGNLVTQAGGIMQIEYSDQPLNLAAVFPNLNPALVDDLLTSGLVAVEGMATLADGTVVQIVKVTGNATPGDAIIIVHSQLGGMDPTSPPDLDVQGSFLVTWAPHVIEDAGQQYVLLTAEVDEPGLEDFLAGLTGNVGRVANALAEGEVFDVLTALDPNNPGAGLQTLLPLQHSAAAFQNIRASQFFNSAFHMEMAALRASIRTGNPGSPDSPRMFSSSGYDREAIARAVRAIDAASEPIALGMFQTDAMQGTWGGYLGGLGNWDRVDRGNDRLGYRAMVTGVQGGVHYHLSRDMLLGISGGYLWSDLDFRDNFGEGEVGTLRVGPYFSFTPGGGNLFIDAAATWGWHQNEIDRETILGTASSRYDAYDISAFAVVGYDIPVFKRTVLTPTIGVDYTHLRTDSFSESGAGSANLRVDSMTTDSLRLRLGASIAHAFEFGETTIVPEVFAGWAYEFLDNDMDLSSRFIAGGPAFTTQAEGLGRSSILVTGGFSAMAGTAMTLYANYVGEFQSDRTSHGVIAGLDIRF